MILDRWDLLVIAGLLVVAAGAGLIYPPAGLIVLGAGLVGLGVVGAIAAARTHSARSGGDQS